MKEVWDYNVKIAKQAVKMGFQEIQFDYVRFPEGFEKRDDELTYGHGDYGKTADSNVQNAFTPSPILSVMRRKTQAVRRGCVG